MEKKERKKPPHLWKPGQSGNPKGRKKGSRTITEILREKLDVEKYVSNLLALAYDNYFPAIREIYDRLEGRVSMPITGAGGEPLIIHIQAMRQAVGEIENNEGTDEQDA